MRRGFLGLVIVSLLMAGGVYLFGCGGSEPAGESTSTTSAEEEASSTTAATQPDSGAETPRDVRLKFFSASPGGSWYPIAVAAGKVWEDNIDGLTVTHEPGGGVANVIAVNEAKEPAVGLTFSISVADGMAANPPFEQKYTNLRTLAQLYPNYETIITAKDSGITSVSDLKGKRVAPGIKGYTSEGVFANILSAAGLEYSDLDKVSFVSDSDAVDLLKDGHIDAYVDTIGASSDSSLIDLSTTTPVNVLPIPDDLLQSLKEISPGMQRGYLPGGVYKGLDQEVPTVVFSLGILTNPSMPDDLAYDLTKALAENWEASLITVSEDLQGVKTEDLANEVGVEFHPGALRYYEERGWTP